MSFWNKAFLIVAVILGIIMPLLSLDAGNSGDEDVWQYPHAQKIYNYYTTFGSDTSYKTVPEMNPYGMWFETLGVAIEKTFGIDDYQTLRHIMNSLMGWLGILFAGLLARNCRGGGWRAGTIVLILLFLSPRFLGHAFNNPKDIPFAALFMVGLYYIHKFITEYPKPTISTCVKLAIAIGLSVAIRVGGLLLYAYFGFFVALYYIVINKPKDYFSDKNKSVLRRLFISFVCVVLGAFLITIPLWPYIMENPVGNTIQAFKDLSHYTVSIRQTFEGYFQWSNMLPWYYTPKYILMTVPIGVIIGFVIYPFVGGWEKGNRYTTFIMYFACIFPVFWIVYSNANVYGGWRHALFSYPPMVVCAGLGFNALIELCKNKYLKIAATALPFLLLIMPFIHIIKNHPYEYVYFNKLSGGMKNAYGKYELDYYYHSTREATEWIIANAEKSGLETGNKIRVATWHPASVNYYFRKDTADFQVVFSRWYERGNNDWDYAIFVVTGIMPEQIRGDYFPPKNTVHTIDVDGKPICLILKRDNKADYEASLLRTKVNESDLSPEEKYRYLQQSINKYKEALVYDSNNEVALSSIVELYMAVNLDSAMFYMNKLITICPIESYLGFASNIYMSAYEQTKNQQYLTMGINANERMVKNNPHSPKNQYDLAMRYASIGNVGKGKVIMDNFLEKNKRNFQAHYYTAIYYAQIGNGNSAIELLESSIRKFPKHEQECLDLISQIRGK